jgi:hypothetical protein
MFTTNTAQAITQLYLHVFHSVVILTSMSTHAIHDTCPYVESGGDTTSASSNPGLQPKDKHGDDLGDYRFLAHNYHLSRQAAPASNLIEA